MLNNINTFNFLFKKIVGGNFFINLRAILKTNLNIYEYGSKEI